ncbi:MAG: DUF3850 domain-containing protein [Candidatus Obscuribacterales bacterium]|nr:DUF3850 domain-containing protein [Candidatus Obscuribacterales bacterium]
MDMKDQALKILESAILEATVPSVFKTDAEAAEALKSAWYFQPISHPQDCYTYFTTPTTKKDRAEHGASWPENLRGNYTQMSNSQQKQPRCSTVGQALNIGGSLVDAINRGAAMPEFRPVLDPVAQIGAERLHLAVNYPEFYKRLSQENQQLADKFVAAEEENERLRRMNQQLREMIAKRTERKPVTHTLKCDAQYFDAVLSGKKNFEVRKADRDFQVGDTIVLVKALTPQQTAAKEVSDLKRRITYVLHDFEGLRPDYCALALEPV